MRVLVAVVLCLLTACCASLPNRYERDKAATLRLEWADGRVCSAVATGSHHIVTATHCVVGVPNKVQVSGQATTYTVIADDGHDHVLLRTPLRLRHVAELRMERLDAGRELHLWGNPEGIAAVFRIARVAGADPKSEFCVSTVKPPCPVIYLDGSVTHGDSGAALFDSDGHVVGIESGGVTVAEDAWSVSVFYPFAFTADQLRQARQ